MSVLFTEVSSTAPDEKARSIKVFVRGKDDVQTATEVGPFGLDSNPLQYMTAIFAQTEDRSEPVIIGYMNTQQIAEQGEIRMYSTDSAGAVQAFVWLKKDGTIQLGGDADNAVRFSPLDTALKNFATFMNQQFALIAAGISAGGGSYSPGSAQIDIAEAKIEKIKTL